MTFNRNIMLEVLKTAREMGPDNFGSSVAKIVGHGFINGGNRNIYTVRLDNGEKIFGVRPIYWYAEYLRNGRINENMHRLPDGHPEINGTKANILFMSGVIIYDNDRYYKPENPIQDQEIMSGKAAGIGVDDFEPGNLDDNRQALDARKRGMVEVLLRPDQVNFRQNLIRAYGCCMVSDCRVPEALEAAHIIPFRDERTSNNLNNGLLLRADIHRLFDCGLIAIDPDDNFQILLHNKLRNSFYKRRHRQGLCLPEDRRICPSKEALRQHKKWTGIEW